MTKDGFMVLTMGFTGKKALSFKLAYIDAFNKMADYIQNQRNGLQFRFFEKEREFKDKRRKASAAGQALREWKSDKPLLETEMGAIIEKMQPQLPFIETTTVQ